jgi:hypothetical protein
MAINFFDLNETKQTKVVNLVCDKLNYEANKIGAETKLQFVKRFAGTQIVDIADRYHQEKVKAEAIAADPGLEL